LKTHYSRKLKMALRDTSGTNTSNSTLTYCMFSLDEGIKSCPIFKQKGEVKEFVVVAHNPSLYNSSMLRLKLDHQDYKAKIWSRENKAFEDVDTDIIEQLHLVKNRNKFDKVIDYEMYIPMPENITAGEVVFAKIERNNGDKGISMLRYKQLVSNTSLEVAGITDQQEVTFHYTNDAYNMSQLFTVDLRSYNVTGSINDSSQFSVLHEDISFQHGSFVD